MVPSRSTASSNHRTPSPTVTQRPSPRKTLRTALINVLSPPVSKATSTALANNKAPRKRIQKPYGECLTEDSAMKRLREEMEAHKNKGIKKTSAATSKKGTGAIPKTTTINKCLFNKRKNSNPPSEPSSSSEDEIDSIYHHSEDPSKEHLLPIDMALNNKNKNVIAMYDDQWYISVIEEQNFDAGEFHLKFMHPYGPSTSFYWPNRADKCALPLGDILGILRIPPEPKNA